MQDLSSGAARLFTAPFVVPEVFFLLPAGQTNSWHAISAFTR